MKTLRVALAFLVTASPVVAQGDPSARTVEVVGLRTWTVAMLQDSLARYGGGVTLADAACAVVLRDVLGFADAAVESWPTEDGRGHTVVLVVEPNDSARVSFHPLPADSAADRQEWAQIVVAIREDPGAGYAVQDYAFFTGASDGVFGRDATKTQRAVRDGLLELDPAVELDRVLWTLREDANPFNRIAALLILARLPEREDVWHRLVETLRSAPDFSGSYATLVLGVLSRERSRPVDWSPVADDLEYLLGGTNLFAFTTVLDVLARTEIDRGLAERLVRAQPHMILAALEAEHAAYSRPARALLVHVRGSDLGPEPAAWREWLGADRATPFR